MLDGSSDPILEYEGSRASRIYTRVRRTCKLSTLLSHGRESTALQYMIVLYIRPDVTKSSKENRTLQVHTAGCVYMYSTIRDARPLDRHYLCAELLVNWACSIYRELGVLSTQY